MKPMVLILIILLATPLGAESSGTWQGYVTYAPQPVATAVGVHDDDYRWLKDVGQVLKNGAFTFLARRDSSHWMGLSDRGTWWMLQIHDETAHFNFRARVDATSGRITVEKGVDWAGSDRNADAAKAAEMAVGYLSRARNSKDVFSAPPTTVPAADHGATASHATADAHGAADAHTSTGHADTSAPVHGDMMVGNGGLELWQRLVDGNLRFVSGRVTHPNQSVARIEETAKGQKPFAIVVTCSDSRVPPEVLFDQGIGDLFVVRTAGEVVSAVELGSIEYAVEHLGATYLVVLGHERCGAVDATLKGGDLPPNIEAIAAQIRPAVEASRFFKGDPLDNAIREHAKMVLAKIKGSEIVGHALHAGKLNVKAAYYDLDTGRVAALP